jgi:hypothetical protein
LSLFPDDDILAKEKLPEDDRVTFMKMLNDYYMYSRAINAKGKPFPSEAIIMALLFSQHKLIEWLEIQLSMKQK